MGWQPITRLQVSGHRFLMRRIECALLHRDLRTVNEPIRAQTRPLLGGTLLATIVVAGCAILALLRPQPTLPDAPIVMGQESGALYVRVGETLHPVLNLASARLIAATDANPQPVRESELGRTKRGPLLGIPGAPQFVAQPIDEPAWTVCDTRDSASPTTVLVGAANGSLSRRLAPEQTMLVAPDSGALTYLLYHGRRAVVDLGDSAVVRALRLEDIAPQTVSRALLNAVPEAPPITAPRVPGAGNRGPAALPGFPVGSVLRVTRADGDEYYVVLSTGVQRVGQVAADLVRLTDSQGARTIVSVAPDIIRASPTVNALPVSTFPDRASAPLNGDDPTLCVTWAQAGSAGVDISFAVGGLPVPAGLAPVALAQGDGNGSAVDAVYVPPGRSAYVRSTGLGDNGHNAGAGTRYLVADTGVRFAIHDAAAAHDLGLPETAVPAPWPVLATLPSGPELSRQNASVARDTVAAGAGLAPQPP